MDFYSKPVDGSRTKAHILACTWLPYRLWRIWDKFINLNRLKRINDQNESQESDHVCLHHCSDVPLVCWEYPLLQLRMRDYANNELLFCSVVQHRSCRFLPCPGDRRGIDPGLWPPDLDFLDKTTSEECNCSHHVSRMGNLDISTHNGIFSPTDLLLSCW